MREKAYQPDRGDFIFLDFTPQAGTEQAGHRPALVLSPKEFNIALGLAAVCPITNTATGSNFEVQLPEGTSLTGVVLTHQFRVVDWIARGATYHSRAKDDLMWEVRGRVAAILAIDG